LFGEPGNVSYCCIVRLQDLLIKVFGVERDDSAGFAVEAGVDYTGFKEDEGCEGELPEEKHGGLR